MTAGMKTVIHPVRDLEAARRLYRALLGVEPYVDEQYYVGFRVAGQELGLDPNGHAKGMIGPLGYWHVDDIHQTVDALVSHGGQLQGDITNVGGNRLIATITDTDGNSFGLLQDPPVEEAQ
jgi:predicted enzyme related to lactoylglutathione lyase